MFVNRTYTCEEFALLIFSLSGNSMVPSKSSDKLDYIRIHISFGVRVCVCMHLITDFLSNSINSVLKSFIAYNLPANL